MFTDDSPELSWDVQRSAQSQLLSSVTLMPKIIQDGSAVPVYKHRRILEPPLPGEMRPPGHLQPPSPIQRGTFPQKALDFYSYKVNRGSAKTIFVFQHNSGIQQHRQTPRLSPNCFISSRRNFLRILQLYSNCGLNENQNDMQTM